MAGTSHAHVDRIHGEIKAMLFGLRLPPGERINESALARELGASRTPVREALNRLLGEGLVDVVAGKGFRPAGICPSRIAGLLEARAAIERETTLLAARKRTPDEADLLVAMAERSDRAGMSMEERITADEAFHIEIARMARNAVLERILMDIHTGIRLAHARCLDANGERTPDGHRAIAESIRHGNGWKAMLAMNAHITQETTTITSLPTMSTV